MRVLLATETYLPDANGAAYFTYRLATLLSKRGHNVFVMCPSRSIKSTVSTDNGVTVYGIPSVPVPVYRTLRISPVFISRTVRGPLFEFQPGEYRRIQAVYRTGLGKK